MKRMEVMGKNKKSTVNQNTNDLTVYKVGAAFALLVLALLALGRILNVYATGSTFDVIYRASQTVWTLCVILCAASVAAYIVLRKKSIRKVFPYVFVLSLLAGVTALDLRYFWTEHATALYMRRSTVCTSSSACTGVNFSASRWRLCSRASASIFIPRASA